jgi:hypothetical protein
MSFIPLDHKNFIVNKIKNKSKIEYINSDVSSYVVDQKIDSKSLINNNNFNNFTFEELNISDEDTLKVIKRNSIVDFFNKVSNQNNFSYIEDDQEKNYFDHIKDPLQDEEVLNDSIKQYNFKNYTKIEKNNQKFLIDCREKNKIDVVKKSLYDNYSYNYSLDYYKDLNKGYCNYNSINFFSLSDDLNLKHSNAIIWPNLVNNNSNQYDFLQKDSTISFSFNLRNKKDFLGIHPQCVLHIPDFLNVYVVRNNDLINKYKICIVAGSNTRKNFHDIINDFSIDFDSNQEIYISQESVYVTQGLTINENHWYNLSIVLSKNRELNNNQDLRSLECFIDEDVIFSIKDLNFNKHQNNLFNSYICLGNKINYKEDDNLYTLDYNDVFYYLFGSRKDETSLSGGPYIKKDIDYGKNFSWEDDGSKLIDNIDSFLDINILNKIQEKCESFEGEIHNIRIYSKSLKKDKIKENSYNTVKSLSKEKEIYSLEFYVPVFNINSYVSKKSLFNLNVNSISNMHFSCIYNPYFANSCGGLEISTENYLIDFVNYTKPNVVVDGHNQINFIENNYLHINNLSISSFTDVFNKMKKGIMFNNIYHDLIDTSTQSNGNLIYNNLLILPNDDGKLKVDFNIINEFLTTIYPQEKYFYDNFIVHNISIENLFKGNKEEFFYPLCLNNTQYEQYSLNSNQSNTLSLNIAENLSYDFSLTKDKFYNFSNCLFHDTNFEYDTTNYSYDLTSCNEEIVDLHDELNENSNLNLDISPVIRNYFKDINSLSYEIKTVFTDRFYINNSLVEVNYINYPLGYTDYQKTFDCMFTTIFNVSNKYYNTKIEKESFFIEDNLFKNLSLSFKDNSNGSIHRSDCESKIANWNYVGNIFYKEGICTFFRPEFSYFGKNDFKCSFDAVYNMFVHEINIQAKNGFYNKSFNSSYDIKLRQDENSLNSESSFVYVSDINLHDENFNIIAKAKLSRPAPKRLEDNILFRLKMDY